MKNKILNILIPIIASILFFALVAGIYATAGSEALFSHSFYDSYTLQALAWRRGEAKLDQNYPYLELAIYNEEYFSTHDMDDYEAYREKFGDINAPIEHQEGNEYYVSFPAFPSVPMFFLTFMFGENTPSTLVTVLYLTFAFMFCILIGRKMNLSYIASIGGALMVCVASSALFICTNMNAGGVWFMAQALSLLLTSAAFYFILGNKKYQYHLAFILLACAVGCRPFQIVYFLPFAYIVAKKYSFKILKTWEFYVGPAVIGGSYMWYNYIRFKDPFEFGHNYLPEFMRMPAGQFGIEYLKPNLTNMFKEMPKFGQETKLCNLGPWEFNISILENKWGFAFFICNVIFILIPIVITFVLCYKKKMQKSLDFPLILIMFICIGIHFIMFPLHKTLGGWQFGSRYTADIIPAVLVLICQLVYPMYERKEKIYRIIFGICTVPVLIYGIIFNIFGCLSMF